MEIKAEDEIAQVLRWLTPFAILAVMLFALWLFHAPTAAPRASQQLGSGTAHATAPKPEFSATPVPTPSGQTWRVVLSDQIEIQPGARTLVYSGWPAKQLAQIAVAASRPVFLYFSPSGSGGSAADACYVGDAKNLHEFCTPPCESDLYLLNRDPRHNMRAAVVAWAAAQ